ncbi:MAG: peptidylprolyl isomerase, partial [Planctomycetota bacterium]
MGSRATYAVVGLVLAAAASVTARPEAPPRPGPGEELLPSSNILVKVGADCITSYGVQREVGIQLRGRDAVRRKRLEAGNWTEEEEARLANDRALLAVKFRDALVRRALMAEIALEAGYRANERQMERRLRAAVKEAGGIEALVRKEGRSLNGIRELLRQEDLQRRFFRNFIPQESGPGPREIREYYEANRAALKSPPRVRVRIIFVSSASDRKAAFEKADALKRELRYAPDRFALRARESSDHKASAERGGLFVLETGGEKVEWIPFDELARMNPVVAQVAQKLRPGRVSEVVRLNDGFLLVKLEGLRKGRDRTLPEVADQITQLLSREVENRLIGDWMDYYVRRTYLVDGL